MVSSPDNNTQNLISQGSAGSATRRNISINVNRLDPVGPGRLQRRGFFLTCRKMTVGAAGGGGPGACEEEGGWGVADHRVEIKVGVGRG